GAIGADKCQYLVAGSLLPYPLQKIRDSFESRRHGCRIMHQRHPNIAITGITRHIAALGFRARESARQNSNAGLAPQRFRESRAIADIQPQIESSIRQTKATMIPQNSPRHRKPLATAAPV